ncbi:hypothetical protein OH799_16035 [Nocardia sp. NBC_00881]|nr:hypothetical protein OH799_16035 [Nocardia sp. NBC_00881]
MRARWPQSGTTQPINARYRGAPTPKPIAADRSDNIEGIGQQ